MNRPEMFWYRGLARISSRVCSSGAWCRMRASHDSLVSSMAAHNWPLGFTPAARKASSGTRCSVLPMPSRPRALASRLAGSTVSTSTLDPCLTAAITAAAAAVVVLPTPPGPQATTISLVARSPSVDPLPAAGAGPDQLAQPAQRLTRAQDVEHLFLLSAEQLGQDPVDHHRGQRHGGLLADPVGQLDRLGDRHLLGGCLLY